MDCLEQEQEELELEPMTGFRLVHNPCCAECRYLKPSTAIAAFKCTRPGGVFLPFVEPPKWQYVCDGFEQHIL